MFLYLLPPSEGKNAGGIDAIASRTFSFDLPYDIACHATEKDLKCKGERYEEGIRLNRGLKTPAPEAALLSARERYSGVMYKAIGVESMSQAGRTFFDEQVLILSGMYGILKPKDMIANYKLPVDTKGLRKRWGEKVTDRLISYATGLTEEVIIVDLLSGAYKKMLHPGKIREAGIGYVEVDFLKQGGTKYTHGVKKVKGEWLREVCENKGAFDDFTLSDQYVIKVVI